MDESFKRRGEIESIGVILLVKLKMHGYKINDLMHIHRKKLLCIFQISALVSVLNPMLCYCLFQLHKILFSSFFEVVEQLQGGKKKRLVGLL